MTTTLPNNDNTVLKSELNSFIYSPAHVIKLWINQINSGYVPPGKPWATAEEMILVMHEVLRGN